MLKWRTVKLIVLIFLDKKKLNITLGIVGGVIGLFVGIASALIIKKCRQKKKPLSEKSEQFNPAYSPSDHIQFFSLVVCILFVISYWSI